MLIAFPKRKPQHHSWVLVQLSCAYIPRAGELQSQTVPVFQENMMAWEQQANLQDGAQHLLLAWSKRHLPTEASFTSLEMSLPPFFSCIDSCSLVSILICSTWFGFRNNFFMHAASNPGVPACHSSAAKEGQARTGSWGCSGTLGLRLWVTPHRKIVRG